MKAARVKQLIIHKGSSIRSLADYVSETLEARRQWANTFKMLKEKKLSIKNPILSKTILQE